MSHLDEGTMHAFLDGELAEPEREQVERHLETCRDCGRRLEQAAALSRRASALLAELEPAAVQPPAWSDIERRAAVAGGERPRRVGWEPALAWAASVVLAFGIGWLARSSWQRAPQVVAEGTGRDRQPTVGRVAEMGSGPESPAEEPLRQPSVAPQEGRSGSQEARGRSAPPADVAGEVERPDRAGMPAERLSAPTIVQPQSPPTVASGLTGAAPTARPGPGRPADLEEATSWLGGTLRTVPDLQLQRIELIPGGVLQGGSVTGRTVRLVYTDAAGHRLVLVQQRSVDTAHGDRQIAPVLRVDPDGSRSYSWRDDEGFLLSLEGEVSGDSLRALAERVE